MGTSALGAKALFDELHIPCVVPKSNGAATLIKGASMSPEEICLPFKIMMGNYAECLERGADTIMITGSCGPCRFGEYCELQMKILKKLGSNARMIVIDSPSSIGGRAFWERITSISSESPFGKATKIRALARAYRVVCLADAVTAKAHYLAGYEAERGKCKRLLAECEQKAFDCGDAIETIRLLERYDRKLDEVNIVDRRPLKVSLIGEIYSMIEPFSNLYIEDKLMEMGVSSTRLITPSWWLKDLVLKPLKLNSMYVRKASKAYLPVNVGGHARESIAHAVLSKRTGADGVIQIYPLGCMPEIITRSLLPGVQQREGIPVMSLIMDEVSGEAGYITRIEAFLDMLWMKRKKGASLS